jgi:hypothetical protein
MFLKLIDFIAGFFIVQTRDERIRNGSDTGTEARGDVGFRVRRRARGSDATEASWRPNEGDHRGGSQCQGLAKGIGMPPYDDMTMRAFQLLIATEAWDEVLSFLSQSFVEEMPCCYFKRLPNVEGWTLIIDSGGDYALSVFCHEIDSLVEILRGMAPKIKNHIMRRCA